jgi:pimeloyl-ACP methyl ester carboxylesterase
MYFKRGYVKVTGGWMYYAVWGRGEPVIMLHQSSFSSGEFAKVAPLIAAGGYKVFTPDTMGYGWSDPAPMEWQFKDWVDRIPEFMDKLKIEKAHFIGHHTGALLAAATAAHYPKRVISLWLNGCVVPDKMQAKKFYEAQLKEPPIGPLEIKRDGSHVIRMWKWQLRENPTASDLGVLYATIANWEHYYKQGNDVFNKYFAYDLDKDFPKIKAPALVTLGTAEEFNPNQPTFPDPGMAGRMIPGAVSKTIEGAGILFFYEMPEKAAGIALDWLSEVKQRRDKDSRRKTA